MKIAFKVLLASMCTFQSCNTCKTWLQEHEKNNHYYGTVMGKYLDTSYNGRNEPMVILGSVNTYKKNAYPTFNYEIYNLIDSGDYIIKDSGTLQRILIKNQDTLTYYPQCGEGNDIK